MIKVESLSLEELERLTEEIFDFRPDLLELVKKH